ncbi:MAG TPA: rhodanese-like domain-containing protein [Candidatus Krumholzibacteria bacterium]|nr:rhodanese-like domain-containing protein [Candidatus Krumholzibacteria bacterium]
MPATLRTLPLLVLALLIAAGCGGAATDDGAGISGRIEDGLRVLTVDPAASAQEFTIYRGDYVRVETPHGASVALTIPLLDVAKTFPAADGEKAYFKVPDAGDFPFTTAAGGTGVIHALELTEARYSEVGVQEAADLLAASDPFVLDVRTPQEYAAGHLEGAVLIPIQDLQRRLGELEAHRQEPLFVYCRTGNRSTVAARLLLDAGFEQVINLRQGVVAWERAGLPLER